MAQFVNESVLPIVKQLFNFGTSAIQNRMDYERKYQELLELVQKMRQLVHNVQYYMEIQKLPLYSEEQMDVIKNTQDLLIVADKIIRELPNNGNMIKNFFVFQSKQGKELTLLLEQLKSEEIKLKQISENTIDVLQTVIEPQYKKNIQNKDIYDIIITMKFRAPKQIKDICEKYPHHLKSDLRLSTHFEEHEINQRIYTFKRKDFSYLTKFDKTFPVCQMSKENHCIIEIRRNKEYKPKIDVNQMMIGAEQCQSVLISQGEMQIPFSKPCQSSEILPYDQQIIQPQIPKKRLEEKEFLIYVIVQGKSGITIERNNQQTYVNQGEERELEEGDVLILLQTPFRDVLLAYEVRNIYIRQL